MNQNDLDRQVAMATGESVGRISRLGFSLVGGSPFPLDERDPFVVDWDDVDAQRRRRYRTTRRAAS